MRFFAALDDRIYRVERWFVAAGLAWMCAIVFLDVAHRTLVGASSTGLAVLACGAFVLAWAALARGAGRGPVSAGLWAAVVTAALGALGAGLTHVLPEGLVWSQPVALVTLLWVGFVGASMCTHERRHLRLEVLARRLSPARLRVIGAVSNAVTALFLLWLTLASVNYVGFHWSEWIETEHRGGLFQGTGVPRWLGFAALPWCFAVMGLRFARQAVGVARGAALLRDEAGDLARSAGAAPVAPGGEAR